MANDQLDDDAINALQFVKVIVRQGFDENAGYLTDVSAKMLLVELRRDGLDIVRRTVT